VRSTTPADALAFYEGVRRANPGGLGKVHELDVRNPASTKDILRHKLSLLDVFRLAADWDAICSEWVTDYSTSFELGYPYFRRELSKMDDINHATVNTYLKILSEKPDTLIARKAGVQKARWVSNRAKRALALGGVNASSGRREIERLDDQLRRNGNLLNPGATADLTSSVVAIAMLSGYKP
jgi:triphosphoribosyl-dephospho-CoA synthase